MKVNWKIDYKNSRATCDLMDVEIIDILNDEKPFQEINSIKTSIGFQKIESGKLYFCKVTRISDILFEQNLKDNKILPNFASQLGDIFDENRYKKA